jgi:hypothetical protein
MRPGAVSTARLKSNAALAGPRWERSLRLFGSSANWNKGKRLKFDDRKTYCIDNKSDKK